MFYNYVEDLRVDYHPIHRWFLCSHTYGYSHYFNGKIIGELRITPEQYAEAMKEFNGTVMNNNTYFKKYENAAAALEWLQAMVTMVKLREKGGGF